MAPRYPCSECGSTRFEEIDAIWYCYRGHVQEGGQQVGEDDADFGRFGKAHRQKDTGEKQKTTKVYRGSKGFQLFLKAWQHILWRQSHDLLHRHGLPAELWTIVRELWALRLPSLTSRFQDPVDDMEDSLGLSTTGLSTTPESATETEEEDGARRFRTSHKTSDNPTLFDTISLNYLGILILRYPMTLSTIYEHIRQENICFIRAIRYVPKEIRDRLAAEYHLALDTITIPSQQDLQQAVFSLAIMYGTTFDMTLPPLNWSSILLNNIENMGLPVEIFTCVKYLVRTVGYDFTYPSKRIDRRTVTAFPEAQLMSLVVVATKLLYPFDSESVEYLPYSISEPAALKMNWDAWLDARKDSSTQNQESVLSVENAIEATDEDILAMPEEQLDQYMDWFQNTYSNDVGDNDLHKQILDMFPLKKLPSDRIGDDSRALNHQPQALDQAKRIQSRLEAKRAVTREHESSEATSIQRPGQLYQRFRSTAHMSAPALRFHQDAAELACLNIDALLRACLRTERTILSQQHEARRAEYFAEEDDGK